MSWIVIRNWQIYQHRDTLRSKERGTAPWIKDYVSQLHDDDYLQLTLAQRGLLHGLRQEYAQSAGRCPADVRQLSRRLQGKVEQRQLNALIHAGFITISASKPPAIRQQPASLEEKREDIASSVTGSINGPVPVPVPSELATKDEEIDFAPPAGAAPSGSGAGAGDLETLDYAASLSALAREEEA